ncbi:MAG TPA: enolase C-terminal domain-like protein, partial [Pseudobdellovibrionaceae bacterium]|nr:enolase C-terminal domain-like protein [Pseudobdellovibrionaceae bacterium]
GDEPLEVHLESLKSFRPTRLVERSLALAERDAKARSRNLGLGSSDWLKNNALVTDISRVSPEDLRKFDRQDFSTIKVKCGTDAAKEVEFLESVASSFPFRIRLDFNSGSADFLEKFLKAFPRSLDERVEYAEDPCPYDPGKWNEIRKRWPLALDHELVRVNHGEDPAADILVLKPARQNVEVLADWARQKGMAVTLTSSMDHPVGVAHALAVAFDLRKESGVKILESGFLTLDRYVEDEFAARFPVEGPWMAMPEGTGIGFDELLTEAPWSML